MYHKFVNKNKINNKLKLNGKIGDSYHFFFTQIIIFQPQKNGCSRKSCKLTRDVEIIIKE